MRDWGLRGVCVGRIRRVVTFLFVTVRISHPKRNNSEYRGAKRYDAIQCDTMRCEFLTHRIKKYRLLRSVRSFDTLSTKKIRRKYERTRTSQSSSASIDTMRYDRCKFWSELSSYWINFGMHFEVKTVMITKNSVLRDYALGDVWIRTNPTHRWITGLLKNALHQNHIQLERMHHAHNHPFCGSKTYLENCMGFNRNGGEASIKKYFTIVTWNLTYRYTS